MRDQQTRPDSARRNGGTDHQPVLPRTVRAAAAAGVLLLAVAGCTSSDLAGDASGSSGAGGGGAVAEQGGAAPDQEQGAETRSAPDETSAAGLAGLEPGAVRAAPRSVVSSGSIGVEVGDVDAGAREVTRLAEAAGGLVTASSSGSGEVRAGAPAQAPAAAQLTLRVPGDRFAGVVDDVGALGRTTGRSTSADDVTAEVADVDSRVASAEAVLVTFRERLPEATSVQDVLAVEEEIAQRQADLEALQARQRALADQVSLATLEVSLTTPPPGAPAAAGPSGFTGGLAVGWRALAASAGAGAVVLGAVLPFALPAVAVATPVLVLRRRRSRAA